MPIPEQGRSAGKNRNGVSELGSSWPDSARSGNKNRWSARL